MTKELLDTQTRSHHPHSPSSLQSSEACPKFLNEDRESEAAAAGTLQHKATEKHDLTILEDEDQVNAVKLCLEYEAQVRNWFVENFSMPPLELREVYLPVGKDVITDDKGNKWDGVTGGFPDIVLYSLTNKYAHVLDWKFGKEPVTETKSNLQGISYALGVFQMFKQIDRVCVHFVAPYQDWGDEHIEKYVHEFKRSEIPQLELRIRTVIARKLSTNAQPSPRTDLCLWCARKGECPALAAVALQVSSKYHQFVVPDVVDPTALTLPEQYSMLYDYADQFGDWVKAVKKRIVDAAVTEGVAVPGYSIVRRQDRTVESLGLFKQAALKNGVSEQEFFETLTVSITKVEELVKSKAQKGEGAAAVRQLASDLDELGAVGKADPAYHLRKIKTPADRKRAKAISSPEETVPVAQNSNGYLE